MAPLVALVFLAVIWVAFLVTPSVRQRLQTSPTASIGAFERRLTLLDGTRQQPNGKGPGRRVLMPRQPVRGGGTAPRPARRRSAERRRLVTMGLGASMGLIVVLGLIPGMRVLLYAAFGFGVMFLAYLALAVEAERREEERKEKLRRLQPRPPRTTFRYAARHAVGGSGAPVSVRRS